MDQNTEWHGEAIMELKERNKLVFSRNIFKLFYLAFCIIVSYLFLLLLTVFQMQSLTSCQCSVCHECFGSYFNITVRDKHIRDMVCPICSEPDINDPEQLDSYFSTLDIQVPGERNMSPVWPLHFRFQNCLPLRCIF